MEREKEVIREQSKASGRCNEPYAGSHRGRPDSGHRVHWLAGACVAWVADGVRLDVGLVQASPPT